MKFKELSSYIARTKLILQDIWVKFRSDTAHSLHSHLLLFEGSQIRGVPPKIKIYILVPLTDRTIKIVRQIKPVFEPHSMMFKELKVKKNGSPAQCFCKENTNAKNIITLLFGWGCQLFADFRFSLGSWTNLQEKQKTTVLVRLTASAIQGKIKRF